MTESEPIARAVLGLWAVGFDTADIADLLSTDEPRAVRVVQAALDARRDLAMGAR